ncbi:hypothetical protein Anas_12599 [Armadillidium nasatum]|uniref:Uncharacterized protein n=1 Tax=Armadillidium nasatum TaxID=96803 RepID=A0A5N5SZP7_9CRUS|nr:hypothetical protein Anas_12599 [Armadillidium nasatum]
MIRMSIIVCSCGFTRNFHPAVVRNKYEHIVCFKLISGDISSSTKHSWLGGRKNILADALSRSPVPAAEDEPLDIPVEEIFEGNYIPPGFKQVIIPGGGDSLFRCFGFWAEGSEEAHVEIRETLVNKLIKDPHKYNLGGRNLLKKLRLMIYPGQVPIPEVIQVFADVMKCKVLVYYNSAKPLVYGEKYSDTCYLSCVSGIHYNLLIPEGTSDSVNEIISINLVRIHSQTSNSQIHSTLLHNSSVDIDTLKQKQHTDRVLKSLSKVVLNKVPKIQWPKNLTAFKPVAEHIFITEGLLLIQHRGEDKFIVPFSYMVSLATQFHVDYGHLGRNKYSQVRIPDITVPVTTRLETLHISPFQNINRTPTITSMHTTLVVPGCQSVETCSSGNQVVGESAVEDRVNEMYERDSNSTINSTIGNSRRMSADFAILRFLCRSTGESVVSDNGLISEEHSDSQSLCESVFEGFTEGRGNIRDIRDILNPNSASYNLGFPEDTLSSIGEHSETMECTLDEYIEDSYILSPELEMRTKVVDTIVTTTISNVVGPRTRSHGPVPDHIHVLTNPLEYKRKTVVHKKFINLYLFPNYNLCWFTDLVYKKRMVHINIDMLCFIKSVDAMCSLHDIKMVHILVIGDSEVIAFRRAAEELERRYLAAFTFDAVPGRSIIDGMQALRQIFARHMDIVLVLGLTCYSWHKVPMVCSPHVKLVTNNPNARLESVAQFMQEAHHFCSMVNPRVKMFLVLPSVKNIYNFNVSIISKKYSSQAAQLLSDMDKDFRFAKTHLVSTARKYIRISSCCIARNIRGGVKIF